MVVIAVGTVTEALGAVLSLLVTASLRGAAKGTGVV